MQFELSSEKKMIVEAVRTFVESELYPHEAEVEHADAISLELAQHKWARLKANNSLECRNCHNLESMDFTRQSKRAMDLHSTVLARGEKTCIDCHKGIAHRLPDIAAVVPR